MKYIYTSEIHNLKSPGVVVPILLTKHSIKSVLDVGAGVGTWLREFQRNGIHDLLGVDIQVLEKEQLFIEPEKVRQVDLTKEFDLGRRFDLVICLEVAEHIAEEGADNLVSSLIKHADKIVFSAAIPNQGGQYHVNEQWPAYWQKKFEKHGYFFQDDLRPLIWTDDNVDWWYRQNLFTVVRRSKSSQSSVILPLVHPAMVDAMVRSHKIYLEDQYYGRIGFRRIFVNFIRACYYRIISIFNS